MGIQGDLEGSVIVSADSSVSESHSALVPVFVDREASAADGRADESLACRSNRGTVVFQHSKTWVDR